MTKSKKIYAPRAVWTEAQIAFLQTNYARLSAPALAAFTGQSCRAIYTKAAALGLKKSAAVGRASTKIIPIFHNKIYPLPPDHLMGGVTVHRLRG